MAYPVTHFEINARDASATQKFYQDLFGWGINTNNPDNYGMIDTKNEGTGINGGIGASRHGKSWVTFRTQEQQRKQAKEQKARSRSNGNGNGTPARGRAKTTASAKASPKRATARKRTTAKKSTTRSRSKRSRG